MGEGHQHTSAATAGSAGAARAALLDLDDVTDAHDLHVWTLTSGMEVASAHVVMSAGPDTHRVPTPTASSTRPGGCCSNSSAWTTPRSRSNPPTTSGATTAWRS